MTTSLEQLTSIIHRIAVKNHVPLRVKIEVSTGGNGFNYYLSVSDCGVEMFGGRGGTISDATIEAEKNMAEGLRLNHIEDLDESLSKCCGAKIIGVPTGHFYGVKDACEKCGQYTE